MHGPGINGSNDSGNDGRSAIACPSIFWGCLIFKFLFSPFLILDFQQVPLRKRERKKKKKKKRKKKKKEEED